MLFHYQGKPERLLRLFKSYRGLDLRLGEYRIKTRRRVLWLSVIYLLMVVIAANLWESTQTFWFILFIAAGWLLLKLAFIVNGLFRRFPRKPYDHGDAVVLVFQLCFFGFVIFQFYRGLSLDKFFAMLTTNLSIGELLPPWALATVGVWLVSRYITWRRLGDETIQQYELDFLVKLLYPLLHDLPADASCTLVCNPFKPIWSENLSSDDRNGRRYKIRDDVLLDFQAKLADESSLSLQTQYRRVDKYKIRKMKYKGTKHRLALICRLRHPALARLGEEQLQQFGEICQSLEWQTGNYATQVRRELAEGKVVVVTKGQFYALRDLTAEDLPSVRDTLEAIRRLSSFITRSLAA